MKENAQLLPETPWEQEPEFTVLPPNGDNQDQRTTVAVPRHAIRRRARPEMEVLGWKPRLVRLGR
jgi:hypothetical protein